MIGAFIGRKDKKWKFERFLESTLKQKWKKYSSFFAVIITGVVIYATPHGLNLNPTYLIFWSMLVIALILRRTSIK
jgi:hypothetical protein